VTRLFTLLLLFVFLFIVPLAILAVYSLSSSWYYPDIIPKKFDNRALVFLQHHWQDISVSLLSSTLYSIATVCLSFVMVVLPAKVFARCSFTGKYLLEGLFLAPALIPPMAFAMGAHYVFIHIGLADTRAGVVIVLSLFSYPYMLRALTAGYQVMGENYELCSRNMGAGTLRLLISIELPLLFPAIIAGGTIVFLVSFSEYFLVFLIGGGTVSSYSGYIFPLLNSSDKSVASLLTLLFLVVPILLFISIDRVLLGVYRKRGII